MEARIMENDNGNDSIYQIIREINDLLQKLEDTIRAAGINTPEENINLKERIRLPSNYIRKVKYFEEVYLLHLFKDKELSKNIAYSIQYTDFLNYILSRTTLGKNALSIGSIFRKYATISVTSIIEAYLVGICEFVADMCGSCKNINNCIPNGKVVNKDLHRLLRDIKEKKEMAKFKEALEIVNKIAKIDQNLYDVLEKLREMRNHIHIQYFDKVKVSGAQIVRTKDFSKTEFRYPLQEYNKAIVALKSLPKVFQNVIDRLAKCSEKVNSLG